MHIAIDCRELVGRPTGVGRYLASLIEEWTRLPEGLAHTYSLYSPAPLARVGSLEISALRADRFEQRVVPAGSGTAWEQLRLAAALRRDRPDVLFAPAYSAPLLTRVPVALCIHDLSFFAHPEWFRAVEGARRRWVTARAAAAARIVLTVSAFSRQEIVERLGIPERRVRTIPHGLALPTREGGRGALGGQTAGRAREACGPMVLFAGSIFNRRRLPDLLQAFAVLVGRHPDVRLEVAGDDRTFPSQDLASLAERRRIAGAVAIRSYVSDEELRSLYGRAGVFAFLSEYEGFGLPPLEALAAGVPSVVLDTPIAREIYGPAARYVTAGAIDETAAALEALLFDPAARDAVLRHAPAVLARYSWDRAARETLAAIEDAARQT